MNESDKNRFLTKIKKLSNDGCWIFLGKGRSGKSRLYGSAWANGRTALAHRVAYEIFISDIPPFIHVLHKCDNPICVNPKHLFLGTNIDNIRDKMAKGRWNGGRPKFTPDVCSRCGKLRQIVKGACRSCYTTIKRQRGGYRR